MAKKTSGKTKTRKVAKTTKGRKKLTTAKSRTATLSRTKSAGRKSPAKRTTRKTESPSAKSYSIVRIMGHGQYRMRPEDLAELNKIDNSIVKFVENHHDDSDKTRQEFQGLLHEMITIIRSRGEELGEKELVPSDVILPFVDTTLEEARSLFKGEGLIPE